MPRNLVEIAEVSLRDWLKTFKPGRDLRLPSERALARDLNLHYYALNRAMNLLIAEGTIRREGNKLYWLPPKEGQEKLSFSCDLLLGRGSVLLSSYQKLAQELGLRLKIHFWQSVEDSVSLLENLNPAETQCVILDPPDHQPSAYWETPTARFVRQGIPVITISQLTRGVSCVISDNLRNLELMLDHLQELGHAEIALLDVLPDSGAPWEVERVWPWLCSQKKLETSMPRLLRMAEVPDVARQAKTLTTHFKKSWPGVSALIVHSTRDYPAQQLLDELKKNGCKVPENLSLGFLSDPMSREVSVPSVTTVSRDIPVIQESAFLLARRLMTKKKEFGLLPSPFVIRVQDKLVRRETTLPGPFAQRKEASTPAREIPFPDAVPLVNPEARLDLDMVRRRPYDLTARALTERFSPVDLAPYVNRPLNYRRGWLGDLPLRNLPPGHHSIHGVPFQVLGGPGRLDQGAIVFQSLRNARGTSGKLPVKLTIPVGSPVQAVYVLHGCGYSGHLNAFATYAFYQGKKKLGEIEMVSLGVPRSDSQADYLARANIQDWWPDYPHYDFDHARMAPVSTEGTADNAQKHEYLYTLEWINPEPGTPLTRIEISVDPSQSTTLGVLAITLLKE